MRLCDKVTYLHVSNKIYFGQIFFGKQSLGLRRLIAMRQWSRMVLRGIAPDRAQRGIRPVIFRGIRLGSAQRYDAGWCSEAIMPDDLQRHG